jgi:hypothetical protein
VTGDRDGRAAFELAVRDDDDDALFAVAVAVAGPVRVESSIRFRSASTTLSY